MYCTYLAFNSVSFFFIYPPSLFFIVYISLSLFLSFSLSLSISLCVSLDFFPFLFLSSYIALCLFSILIYLNSAKVCLSFLWPGGWHRFYLILIHLPDIRARGRCPKIPKKIFNFKNKRKTISML